MSFKNDSDPELIAQSATVVQSYTQEAHEHLLSLIPTPQSVQANHTAYAASYAAFLGGDLDKAEECETYRIAVYEGLSILHGLTKAVTVKDPKAPEIVGLGAQPSKVKLTSISLAQPAGFRTAFTPQGLLVGSVTKVEHAMGYQVWACDSDPSVESNWRLVASSSTCKKILIPGLDYGKNNWLKIRAMRGKGVAGPWSNLVNLTPR